MGKYESTLKYVQLRKFVEEKKYDKALEMAENLENDKIRDVSELKLIADVYKQNEKYEEAKELYKIIYGEINTRRTLYNLIVLCIKSKDLDEAESLYEEYLTRDKNSVDRFILRYRIDKAHGLERLVLIKDLQNIIKEDYIEEWAYELAKQYHKAGMIDECVEECKNIVLWFSDGEIAEKAKLLRMHYETDVDNDFMSELQASISSDVSQYIVNNTVENTNDQQPPIIDETANDSTIQIEQEPESEPEPAVENESTIQIEPETEPEPGYEYDDNTESIEPAETEDQYIVVSDSETKPTADVEPQNAEDDLSNKIIENKDKYLRLGDYDSSASGLERDVIEAKLAAVRLEAERIEAKSKKGLFHRFFSKSASDDLIKSAAIEANGLKETMENNNKQVNSFENEKKKPTIKVKPRERKKEIDVTPSDKFNYEKTDIEKVKDNIPVKEKISSDTINLSESIAVVSKYSSDIPYIHLQELLLKLKDSLRAPLNFAIASSEQTYSVAVVKRIAKQLQIEGYLDNSKIAKINADKLNTLRLDEQVNELFGSCIMIDNASEINSQTINSIISVIDAYPDKIVFILIDNEENLSKMLFKEEILRNQIKYFVA